MGSHLLWHRCVFLFFLFCTLPFVALRPTVFVCFHVPQDKKSHIESGDVASDAGRFRKPMHLFDLDWPTYSCSLAR